MIMDNGQITGAQTQGGEPKIEPRLSLMNLCSSRQTRWLSCLNGNTWDISGIALMHPLFSLKLADIGKFCFICPVVYAGSLPIAGKNV